MDENMFFLTPSKMPLKKIKLKKIILAAAVWSRASSWLRGTGMAPTLQWGAGSSQPESNTRERTIGVNCLKRELAT